MRTAEAPPPLPNSYWVEPGRILAGEYPAGADEEATLARLRRLLDAGIDCFIDLTEPGERQPYESFLPGPYSSRPVVYQRLPIRDHGLPRSPAEMQEILDELDAALAEGRCVYLHCRAGIGRTNLVAGCWFAAAGIAGDVALARLNARWQGSARAQSWPTVPETDAQSDYVRGWQPLGPPRRDAAAVLRAPVGEAPPAGGPRERVRGLMLGLAAGDALGQSARGLRPGQEPPSGEFAGNATRGLPPGAWSDKTAMALCLAESVVQCGGADGADQVRRYRSWQRDGHWSSTGACVGISAATAKALATAQWTGNPYSGSHDPVSASAEPLARLGPVVAWYRADARVALDAAASSARVTHQAPLVLDAARYLAALLVGALAGAGKDALLAPMFSPEPGLWEVVALRPRIREIAEGSWRRRRPRRLVPPGQEPAVALEAALWSFGQGHDLRQCLQAAAGLGGEADTVAAITGQLAGAHYGESALPAGWRACLARGEEIVALADALFAAAPAAAAKA
ncbi:MAG: ADP-ribosylglycohydrolase family protein [Steroidobacteraceae bacterium]|nr:ADP-ribosylglycohydrolase family protein [Steroidobacteraceae bacterium]